MGDPATPGDASARAREVFARFLEEHGLEDDAAFGSLLARHPDLMAALRDLYVFYRSGHSTVAFVASEEAEDDAITDSAERVRSMIARLRAQASASTRLEERGEIARGGMGAIHRLFDPLLRRTLAKKVLIKDGARVATEQRKEVTIGRFLDEAQITAQLDHPGVVPVHDIGLDENGAIWFTMRLVKGEDLRAIFEKSRTGTDGWNLPRAVSVLLKVCETMAYAHGKDVIHRDVKPSNVMVGRFGETYVMDWGLARVLGRPDPRDLRIRPEPKSAVSGVQTDLRDGGTPDSPDSPLVTMDGQVVGTPAYMSPEQACGETEKMGKQADVYSVGAALYELLAGHMPYVPVGRNATQRSVLKWVQDGPPHPLRREAPGAPAELVAICEKAMARRIRDRYPDMEALAEDLRAWLEGRVVRAHQTGAIAEFVKWTRRNRGTAAALMALLLVIGGAGFAAAWQMGKTADAERTARREAQLRLDGRDADALVREFDSLFPVDPSATSRMRVWLGEASQILKKRDDYEREFAALAARGTPEAVETGTTSPVSIADASERSIVHATIKTIEDADQRLSTSELGPVQRETIAIKRDLCIRELAWRQRHIRRLELLEAEPDLRSFPDSDSTRRYIDIGRMLRRMSALSDPSEGLVVRVEARLRDAESLHAVSIDAERNAWNEAIAAVADRARCPRYEGLTIVPQLGLVPLRVDPVSGLHEFWHVLSGARPEPRPEGGYRLTPESGIVLVLVPGGRVLVGPRTDRSARFDERDRELDLAPYLLSKYEMTLAQWMRLADELPNEYRPAFFPENGPLFTFLNPVESVSFESAFDVLARFGLTLPTEAQWENAARGGTDSAHWFTEIGEEAGASENLNDPTAKQGYLRHAPVDAFPSNPFGFHCMLGNVSEWCLDWYWAVTSPTAFLSGTGEHVPFLLERKSIRGGLYRSSLEDSRVSMRRNAKQWTRNHETGVRPCRILER